MSKTAVIIGAGPAGLTAAYRLLTTTDIKPVILEETGIIGGISRTAEYAGNRIDIGGHRFFSKVTEVTDLWKELMPLQGSPAFDDALLQAQKDYNPGGPDPERDDNVMLLRRRVSRIFYLKSFFDYPVTLKFSTFKNMGLWRTIKAGFGYIRSAIFKRTENSLEDFYINRFGKPLYSMFFEDYTQKVWGVHPSKMAPDWGSQRVKGLSLAGAVFAVLKKPFVKKGKVETSLIEEFWYPKKGPGQLWERMAEEVTRMGGDLRMNTKVEKINLENGAVSSLSTNKGDVTGDWYLSSMPVKDLLHGMDRAPADVKSIAESLPYRDFITVGLLLKGLKIKNRTKIATVGGIVPDCWIYIQERDVKIARLQIFNNWSPYMVKDLENTVWVGLEYMCNEGDELWSMSDTDFIDFAAGELQHAGIIDKSDILDSVRINIKKAYPAYFGAYENFPKVREYLDTIPNLYCIGRNGQHRYNNMDHSMLTAIEAVKSIAGGGGNKSGVWNVNTEEEYHETK